MTAIIVLAVLSLNISGLTSEAVALGPGARIAADMATSLAATVGELARVLFAALLQPMIIILVADVALLALVLIFWRRALVSPRRVPVTCLMSL